jgi:hypothetical protein
MKPAPDATVYVVGGTVQASGGIYIKRSADDTLFDLCRRGVFSYVLSSRQVGKSSLMVRTAERLLEHGCRAVVVDLTHIGAITSAEAWYRSLAFEIASQLNLPIDLKQWWASHGGLADAYRFTRFFHLLVDSVPDRMVVFVDEIDTTIALTFTDDFFAAVRGLHNLRAMDQRFDRLSFVLLGAATPLQLIQDPNRTPFNLGERVELTDFAESEAQPLLRGLDLDGADATVVLRTVLAWTGGHPYLTLRTFHSLQTTPMLHHSAGAVEERIRGLFFGDAAEADTNLNFVRDMLTIRAGRNTRAVLEMYKQLWNGGHVVDDDKDPIVSWLKLSGVAKAVQGRLQIRSRIYREAFDADWVRKHLPMAGSQPAVVYASGGAVQAARGIYVERRADALVAQCCSSGMPAYVLAPRQMGKTSLMVRCAERLTGEISTVVVDLARFGAEPTPDRWFLGVLATIAEQLDLDLTSQWKGHTMMNRGHRFRSVLAGIVTDQVQDRVLLFFDEIDVTTKLAFRGEFFGALRSLYQGRATTPQLDRLNFVLLGTGIAEDFVDDAAMSPFVPAQEIELTDYRLEEAVPLVAGLKLPEREGMDVLRTVLALTGGHPYLTLRVFRSFHAQPLDEWTTESITGRAIRILVEPGVEGDANLQAVAAAMTSDVGSVAGRDLLQALMAIWLDARATIHPHVAARLKAIGIIKSTDGMFQLRNRIYEDVFNPEWTQGHLGGWPRTRADA